MVPSAQHCFIVGFKHSGIDEILRETDVSVEVPQEGVNSDSITLRGPPERLGDALALVYSKASSVISQEIHYPEWMCRFLIGPKGATLRVCYNIFKSLLLYYNCHIIRILMNLAYSSVFLIELR